MSTEEEVTSSTKQTPGAMIREARESLGLSLSDVAARTRIPKTMLNHLERDRYDEYAAEVFARGHLRNYALEVGLEPEVVLQSFDRYTGKLVEPEGDEDGDGSSGSGSSQGLSIGFTEALSGVRRSHVVAAVLVVIAAVVVFGLLTGNRATAQDPAKFPEETQESQKDWELEKQAEESRWLLEKPSNE